MNKKIRYHALKKMVDGSVRSAYCGCRDDQNQFLNILSVDAFKMRRDDADSERCEMCLKMLRMETPAPGPVPEKAPLPPKRYPPRQKRSRPDDNDKIEAMRRFTSSPRVNTQATSTGRFQAKQPNESVGGEFVPGSGYRSYHKGGSENGRHEK